MKRAAVTEVTVLLLIFFISCFYPAIISAWAISPHDVPVNEPIQVTSEADPLLYAAVSRDGKWLAYTCGRERFTDLWLRSLDSGVLILPERLTLNPASEFAPAFSTDSRYIAYIGTSSDAKGDIFLLDCEARDKDPVKLTGRETGDGFPCFSPDGKSLYFHRTMPSDHTKMLARLDLFEEGRAPINVQSGGEGAFPSISPDGKRLAFVSFRNDAGGDISILDIATDELTSLTSGPSVDMYPAWSEDGRYVYFSRFNIDTNGDGRIDLKDNARIFRSKVDAATMQAYPLTSADYSALQPQIAGGKIFFLSMRSGVSNLWSLPLDGEIPPQENADEQIELARRLSLKLPPDPYLAQLAYYKVLELFPEGEMFAEAAYAIGKIFLEIDNRKAAKSFFIMAASDRNKDLPWPALSLIEQILIEIAEHYGNAHTDAEKQDILDTGLGNLDDIYKRNDGNSLVQAKCLLEQSRLLSSYGSSAVSLLKSIKLLDSVIEEYPEERTSAAEAMVLKADVYRRIGQAENVYKAYVSVLDKYSDVEKWSDEAIKKILDCALVEAEDGAFDESIELLRTIVEESRKQHPLLSMGALNRIGDLYFKEDKWLAAKAAYREVLDQFPIKSRQRAAARFSLAEIFYREERFRQALDLYEREVASGPSDDHIYRLARTGYIRKSIESGESLYRFAEIAAARTIFKELIDYDYSLVEAHRGYIKCAAAQKGIAPVLNSYRETCTEDPHNYIALYATGLCLTYREKKEALSEAISLIMKAISMKGQIEYFYQTLGYIFEVLETVYKEEGNLEKAVEAYQKAYFLNDHKNNRINAAHLLLNLGNGYYVLGQYGKAYQYYFSRFETALPFDDKTTEIIFYRRFGASAFQIKETEKCIYAYTRVIDLIEKNMNPKEASGAFDRLIRSVSDHILMPAMRGAASPECVKKAEVAKKLQDDQLQISRRLFTVTQKRVGPPPDTEWQAYKIGIESLLAEQRKLNGKLKAIVADDEVVELFQNLNFLSDRVFEAVQYPQRLVQLKVEMLDRLGLAYQESGAYEKAMECFENVFGLNKNLGFNQNLSKNRRSVAYNTYMLAEGASSLKKKELLYAAAEDFGESIELVKKYGVAVTKSKEGREGLITIDLQVALDEADSTKAAHGFSADQEIRLAEAFITRIRTELGELIPAEESIRKQLAHYAADAHLLDADLYGVSLLYHRAGHLSSAREKYKEAFDYFYRSADLAMRGGNAVSSAINVGNMAHLLSMISPLAAATKGYREKVSLADREVARIFSATATLPDNYTEALYHTIIGVHSVNTPCDVSADELEQKVLRIAALTTSFMHCTKAYNLLGGEEELLDRGKLVLVCSLCLNMGRAAQELGQDDRAITFFNEALQVSVDACLPQFQWRALAELGRYGEAMRVLSSVTIAGAGCAPFEILAGFENLVWDLFKENKIEAAFTMVETLSEYERVNRFAPIIRERISSADREICRQVYPRLLKIQQLRGEMNSPEDEEIEQEIRLLDKSLERKLELLAHLGEGEQARKQAVILVGIAEHAEQVADSVVTTNDRAKKEKLLAEYQRLLKKYEECLYGTSLSGASTWETLSPIIRCMRAEPVEAIDCMENLPDDGRMIRLFSVHGNKPGYIAFYLTTDDISARRHTSVNEIELPDKGTVYWAYEELASIPSTLTATYALSATHCIRSIRNRKPFKRSLLTITPDSRVVNGKNESYDITTVRVDQGEQEILKTLSSSHILILDSPVSVTATVPTRAGEVPHKALSVELEDGRRFPMMNMSGRLSNLSLIVMARSALDDAYMAGHLVSLCGCPTLLIPKRTLSDSSFIGSFLEEYSSVSAQEALMNAQSAMKENERWLLVGYRGMNSHEAVQFADKHFKTFVKEGQTALKAEDPERALSLFENALLITKEIQKYSRYNKALYQLARESAYATGDLDKALYYAGALATFLAKEHPDSEEHAEALLRLGLVEAELEHYDKAIPTLGEALEIMENLELDEKQAAALASLGTVLEQATDYDRALGHFESAALLGKKLHKKSVLANQYINIGRIYDLRLSRYARARKSYEQALAIYQESNDAEGIAQSLLNIGRCYRLLGNFSEAARCYEQALESIQPLSESEIGGSRLPIERLRSRTLIEQANNAWFQGEYQDAFDLQAQAYHLAVEHRLLLDKVIALNTSGLIWWTLGDNQRAMRELMQALSLIKDSKDKDLKIRRDEEATTLNNIGLVYREMGQYDEALGTFDKALAIDREIKSRWAIAYDLRNKALVVLRMGEPQAALSLFQEALSETKAIGNRINESKSLLGLAEAQGAMGKKEEAAQTYTCALDLSRSMVIREIEWRSLYGLAKLALEEGDRSKAKGLLLKAIEVIEGMRAAIAIEQLKDGFITNKLSVYETLIALLVDMGDSKGAFEIAERCRSRNFIDLLGNQRLTLHKAIDQDRYDRLKGLKMKIEEQESLLAESSDEDEAAILKQTMERLNDTYEDLMMEIQSSNPQLASLVSINPITIEETESLLDEDVAFLAYFTLPDETVCWFITGDEIELYRIPVSRASLGEAIFDYRRMIQNCEPVNEQSQKLFNWLLAPVQSKIKKIKYCGIIPHGTLHYLSFATLSDGDNYCIDYTSLFYLPSASVFRYTMKRRGERKNNNVLAIGNPDLGDPALALPFSEHEVGTIKWNFPQITTLTKEKATEGWVSKNIDRFGIIHCASHGEFDPINPLFSAIKLAKDEQSDGDLEAGEIFGITIKADLVVLSACQTGLGKITEGDEIIGLNRAFFYAGTHAVISSLWRVSDIATALLIKKFYREYAGDNKADSLRQAALHVKSRYPHPAYWGAFVLSGDYY